MHRDDLGEPRRLSDDPALCSKCGAELGEDEVPLYLFGDDRPDGDCDAWQYCNTCSGPILGELLANATANDELRPRVRHPLGLVRPNREPT